MDHRTIANSVGLSEEELVTATNHELSQLAYEAVIGNNPHAAELTELAAKDYKKSPESWRK